MKYYLAKHNNRKKYKAIFFNKLNLVGGRGITDFLTKQLTQLSEILQSNTCLTLGEIKLNFTLKQSEKLDWPRYLCL